VNFTRNGVPGSRTGPGRFRDRFQKFWNRFQNFWKRRDRDRNRFQKFGPGTRSCSPLPMLQGHNLHTGKPPTCMPVRGRTAKRRPAVTHLKWFSSHLENYLCLFLQNNSMWFLRFSEETLSESFLHQVCVDWRLLYSSTTINSSLFSQFSPLFIFIFLGFCNYNVCWIGVCDFCSQYDSNLNLRT